MQFPTVSGSNLQRSKFTLPQDLQGELNLVLIAFQQWQQTQVDTWIPFARQLEKDHPALRYYELPTIQRLNTLARTFINEGMRAGIPDLVARERTITSTWTRRHSVRRSSCPARTASMCCSWTARGRSCGEPKEPSRPTKASPWQQSSGGGRTRRMSDNPTGGGDKPC